MKAISIRQPWAWLIVEGYKPIENRTWPTKFRGNILIHAGKECSQAEHDQACDFVHSFSPEIASRIPAIHKLKTGGIVGMVKITDCVSKHKSDFFTGPWGFVMTEHYPLPFRPMRGMLGIFQVNEVGLPEECKPNPHQKAIPTI